MEKERSRLIRGADAERVTFKGGGSIGPSFVKTFFYVRYSLRNQDSRLCQEFYMAIFVAQLGIWLSRTHTTLSDGFRISFLFRFETARRKKKAEPGSQ